MKDEAFFISVGYVGPIAVYVGAVFGIVSVNRAAERAVLIAVHIHIGTGIVALIAFRIRALELVINAVFVGKLCRPIVNALVFVPAELCIGVGFFGISYRVGGGGDFLLRGLAVFAGG